MKAVPKLDESESGLMVLNKLAKLRDDPIKFHIFGIIWT